MIGILLAILFVVLCLFILWEHYQEAKQVSTFAALTQMVEEQRLIDRDVDGCDAFECDVLSVPDTDLEIQTKKGSSLLRPRPSLMVASAAPLSAVRLQRTGIFDNSFLVRQDAQKQQGVGQTQQILPQYAALHAQNPDFFGWVRIEGTKVNYPVMYSPQEPERYLHQDFYGDYAKYGVPFIDGVTDVEHSRNLLIHGHNARSGILFGDLDKFLKKSFWEEHRYIHFDTLYEERVYEIVAVVKTRIPKEGEDVFRYYDYVNLWDDAASRSYSSQIINDAAHSRSTVYYSSTHFLTLSTCSYHSKDGRLLVIARRTY